MRRLITITFISICLGLISVSCGNGGKGKFSGDTSSESQDSLLTSTFFAVCEIVNPYDVPQVVVDKLRNFHTEITKINPELAVSAIAFINASDTTILEGKFPGTNIIIARYRYPADIDGQFYKIVALKTPPVINDKDITSAFPDLNTVKVYLTSQGSHKWAQITKMSSGKTLAIIVNGIIYSIPIIKGEDKSSTIVISGLKSEDDAGNLATMLSLRIKK